MEQIYLGGRLCGAVRYAAAGEASHLCFCHCASCRRAVGSPGVPWATFARRGFRVTHGRLAEYRSSARVLRGFCAACGSSLTYRNEARDAEIDVTLASLDEPTRLAPQQHVWVADALPWQELADGRRQFPHGAG